MKNIIPNIVNEFKEALVPTFFFLVVFHLIAVTKTLMLEAYRLTPTGVTVATVGALIVAKAVLIADKLPFLNLFSGKPLIFSVLWKTVIYGFLCLVFRCFEELIPLIAKYEGLGAAARHLIGEVSWPHFWALQIWLVFALILYNTATEIDGYLGAGSLRKAFLGNKLKGSF